MYVLKSCASDIGVGFGSQFTKTDVKIEQKVSIGGYCMIGMCEIGEGTLLGSNIDILSGRHQHGSGDDIEGRKDATHRYSKVKIGKNCWIGNGCIIMNDVGDNCIIGAGSVVVKPIPAKTIAVGNPATVKKQM
ncbi:MAG: acyltransferase [Thermoguttaceae bacterium]